MTTQNINTTCSFSELNTKEFCDLKRKFQNIRKKEIEKEKDIFFCKNDTTYDNYNISRIRPLKEKEDNYNSSYSTLCDIMKEEIKQNKTNEIKNNDFETFENHVCHVIPSNVLEKCFCYNLIADIDNITNNKKECICFPTFISNISFKEQDFDKKKNYTNCLYRDIVRKKCIVRVSKEEHEIKHDSLCKTQTDPFSFETKLECVEEKGKTSISFNDLFRNCTKVDSIEIPLETTLINKKVNSNTAKSTKVPLKTFFENSISRNTRNLSKGTYKNYNKILKMNIHKKNKVTQNTKIKLIKRRDAEHGFFLSSNDYPFDQNVSLYTPPFKNYTEAIQPLKLNDNLNSTPQRSYTTILMYLPLVLLFILLSYVVFHFVEKKHTKWKNKKKLKKSRRIARENRLKELKDSIAVTRMFVRNSGDDIRPIMVTEL